MKILLAVSVLCFFLFILINLSATSVFAQKLEAIPVNDNSELTFEIAVPLPARVIEGYWIEAHVILKNVSQKPVKICTLWSRAGHVWMDNYRVNFYPDDKWIDYPPKNFAEKFIALAPDESFTFQTKIHYVPEQVRNQHLTVSSDFYISKKFAKHYSTWSGLIKAKTVTINIE